MREAASLRGRVILTVRARRCVSCKSVPTLPRECGDIGPDVPFRHPLRRGCRRHPLSSRSSKAPDPARQRRSPPRRVGVEVRRTSAPTPPSPPTSAFDSLGVAGWDCGGNLGPRPSYAARPKSLRYCMGLLQSRPPFILTSLYHLRQASSMPMNSPIAAPAQPQPQPQKNSISNLPKKPSRLALSGLHPFPGIDLARPFSSHILIHPGQRHAAGAVRDGREARLAGGDAELGHVGDPQPVGLVGPETVLPLLVAQQVLGRLGNLAPRTSCSAASSWRRGRPGPRPS